MNLISFIAMIAFVIFSAVVLAASFSHAPITIREVKKILAVYIVIITIIILNVDLHESSSVDIVRHFETIEAMRVGGWEYVSTSARYSDLFVINIFMYLVSLTPYNSLYVAIPTAIDLSIMAYILCGMYKDGEKIKLSDVMFIVICFLAIFSTKYMVLAVRTNLAVAIGSLGIYLEYVKGNHKITGIICYFSSMFIHYFAFLFILVRILLFFIKKRANIWYAILLFYPVMLFALELIFPIGISYFDRVVNSFIEYDMLFNTVTTIKNGSTNTISLYLGFVGISLFALIMGSKNKFTDTNLCCTESDSGKNSEMVGRANKYIFITGIISCGLLGNYLILERFIMVLSYAFLMFLPNYIKQNKNGLWKLFLLSLCCYMIIWDLHAMFVNVTGFNPLSLIGG